MVKTITKRELAGYLNHPTAYLLLVVFLVLLSFFYFRVAYINQVASMRPLLDILIWMLLFFVPALTMRLIAEEKRNNTIDVLFTQPIREWHVLLGKFFAAFALIGLGLLLTLIIPILLHSYGTFDWGVIIAQYVASFFLIGAMVSVGLLASAITKNQIIAFLISGVTLFVFTIIGFDFVTTSLPASLKVIFEQLSLIWHYANMTRGVIDLRDIIYFVTFKLSFLSAAYWLIMRDRVNAKRPKWRQLKIGIVLIIALAIIINLLGLNIRGRIDLTSQNIYTLSPATENILKGLPDVATITLFTSAELPPSVSITARDVKDLLSDYATHSGGNVTVEFVTIEDDNALEAENKGITPVQFNVLSSDEFQSRKGYFGLTVDYLDESDFIPYIERTDDFEYTVTSMVRRLSTDSMAVVGFLSGHGEKSPFSDFATFTQALRSQYDILLVTFDADTQLFTPVPDILVVAGTSEEVSDAERQAIKDFANTGRVLFLIDTLTIDMQTLAPTINEHSLANLVAELGVTVEADIVGDVLSNERVTLGGGAFNYIVQYPFWIRAISEKNSPIVNSLESMVLPWVSSLTPSTNETMEVTELMLTTENGFLQRDNWMLLPDQDFSTYLSTAGSYIIAAAVQAGQSGEGVTSALNGRYVVVGDSDFLTDAFAQSTPENILFAFNAVDWLAQDDELIAVRSKQRTASLLLFESESQKNTVKYINLIGVPVLIVVVGSLHLYRRKRRTRRTYQGKP